MKEQTDFMDKSIAAIMGTEQDGQQVKVRTVDGKSATLQRPAIENVHKALYLQFTTGIVIYYMVTMVGYWAYGSSISYYNSYVLSDRGCCGRVNCVVLSKVQVGEATN